MKLKRSMGPDYAGKQDLLSHGKCNVLSLSIEKPLNKEVRIRYVL